MGFTLTDQSAGFLEIDSFTKIGFIVVLKTGLRQVSGFKLIIGCTVTLCCTKYEVPLLIVRVITGDSLEYEELQNLIDFKSVAAYLHSFNFFSVLGAFCDQVEP